MDAELLPLGENGLPLLSSLALLPLLLHVVGLRAKTGVALKCSSGMRICNLKSDHELELGRTVVIPDLVN